MSEPSPEKDEMREDYDFSGGARGKRFREYRAGHTVPITRANGVVEATYFSLQDGAVMLDPDLKTHFPDSDAVNKALRTLVGTE